MGNTKVSNYTRSAVLGADQFGFYRHNVVGVNMSDIITCSKCGGSGKFIYKSGVTGHCYQCNGKGAVKRIAHKSFAISIMNNDGVRIDWLHINARSQSEAVRKARATAARGCYKDQLDTITATESGIEYTYKTI